MKKIVLMVSAFMAISSASFAQSNTSEENVKVNYAIDFNINSLARSLNLTSDQKDEVEEVHSYFSCDMNRAAKAKDENRQAKLTKRALMRDLAGVRSVLSSDQYRKYRVMLMLTMNNRGIKVSE